MRMAAVYAGYTAAEVENLRKGIGKKDHSIIEKHLVMFKEKALALGRDPQEIDTVLEQVEAAGNYSFNKCLAVGTMVESARGKIGIEDVRPGDPVYSVNDAGEIVVQPVQAIHKNGTRDVYEIVLSNGFRVEATETHKFLTSHGYKAVHELRLGDSLKVLGCRLPVRTIDESNVMSIKWIGKKMTYDLEMPVHHNFVANGVVSHNSHAVAYAMLTYACGYLAANYPLHFFKNLINHAGEEDRTDYLSEVLLRQFTILPPNINTSLKEMSVEGTSIRMGLLHIKSVGDVGAAKIMAARPYNVLKDVTTKLGKSTVATLYWAHALDSLPDIGEYHPIGKIDEVDLLGIPLHGLLAEFKDVVDFIQATSVATIAEAGTCVIKITNIHKHKDRNGKWMAFCEGFDVYGPKVHPLIMFASIHEDYGVDLKKGETYGMVLSRLANGGFSIKALNTVAKIRSKIMAAKGGGG